jgi:hypothetical protein
MAGVDHNIITFINKILPENPNPMTTVITTVAAFYGTMTVIRTGSYSSTTRDLFIYYFSCAVIFYYYYNIITSSTARHYRHRRRCRTARRDTRTCGAADPRVPCKRGRNDINILTFADGGKSLASYTKRSRIICPLPTHHTAASNTRRYTNNINNSVYVYYADIGA